MKTSRTVGKLILGLLASTVLMLNGAAASVSCHNNINAKGSGQDLGGGVTNAQIIGGGLLHGTTVGNFTITGFVPPIASFGGTVVFTTKHGSLTVTINGVLNTETGEFSASGPVAAATEKLAGATGIIMFQGIENLSTGSFIEDVSGLVCVDLAP
jgi:hypothetical protein